MKHLETVLRRTELVVWAFSIVAAIALCALFLLTFGDVAGRFLLNSPIRGTIEVSEYLLVAIGFLALGFAQLTGTHVRMEALLSRLSTRAQTILNIVVLLVVISFFTVMTVQISQRAYMSWVEGIILPTTSVRLPMWWPSFIAAIGCALLIISLLTQLIRNINGLIIGRMVGFKTWTQ